MQRQHSTDRNRQSDKHTEWQKNKQTDKRTLKHINRGANTLQRKSYTVDCLALIISA